MANDPPIPHMQQRFKKASLPQITGTTPNWKLHWTVQVDSPLPRDLCHFKERGNSYWQWHDKEGKYHLTDSEPKFLRGARALVKVKGDLSSKFESQQKTSTTRLVPRVL